MRCTDRKTAERLLFLLLAFVCPASLQADIVITQLANAGVIVTEGQARIMVDGMVVEPYAIYGGLPEAARADFLNARGEFAGIDLALVSHRHHEHSQPEFGCRFLQASPATEVYTSEQVIGLLREFCRGFVVGNPRIHAIAPQHGRPEFIEVEGARVTVFPLTHGTRKYARIQHYAHLLEIGGMQVLHLGDAEMDPAEFERAGLADIRIDVALIPLRFFQPGPGAELIERYLNAPLKIAVHIPPGEVDEVRAYMEEFFPTVQMMDKPMERLRFTVAGQAPPQPGQ
jgi:L-ascorbate metabolism protein UlaG (beta-lactamase superfamily)